MAVISWRKAGVLSLACLLSGLFLVRLIYPPVRPPDNLDGLVAYEIQEVVQKEMPIGSSISQVKTWIDDRDLVCSVFNSDCDTFIANFNKLPDDARTMSAVVPKPVKAGEFDNTWMEIDFTFSANGSLIKSEAHGLIVD